LGHRDIWAVKLLDVQRSPYVGSRNIPSPIKIMGAPTTEFFSIQNKNIQWNDTMYRKVNEGVITPPRDLFVFVEDTYNLLA
jgi:hypothetical protein